MYNKQNGQVLPLGLVMLVLVMLGAFVVFNTGQMATNKMRLANVADAAAYSGALWQARALNFQAYSNRAMVANQVAVAQMVSLRSWAAYGAVTSDNIAAALKAVPFVNVITTGVATGLAAFQQVVSPLTRSMISVIDTVNKVLSASQNIMYLGTFAAIPDVINAVVEQSDSRFKATTAYGAVGLVSSLAQWTQFTSRYNKHDDAAMSEREKMITDSRDSFSRHRNWDLTSFLIPPNPFIKQTVLREGQTRLVRHQTPTGPEWEWKAKDTLSLHTRIRKLFGYRRYELPIGWAEAFANSKRSRRTLEGPGCGSNLASRPCSRYTENNEDAEYLADLGIPSPVGRVDTNIPMMGYSGIRSFNSLSARTIEDGQAKLQLKVEVAMPGNSAVTTEAVGMNGNFAAAPELVSQALSSISVAEVYFQRPDHDRSRSDGHERANGYNPYWTARLANVPLTDRVLAFALRPDSRGSGSLSGKRNRLETMQDVYPYELKPLPVEEPLGAYTESTSTRQTEL